MAGIDGGGGRETVTKNADGWSVELLPSPTRDPVGCRRPGRLRDGSFVCDPDGLLSPLGAQRSDAAKVAPHFFLIITVAVELYDVRVLSYLSSVRVSLFVLFVLPLF